MSVAIHFIVYSSIDLKNANKSLSKVVVTEYCKGVAVVSRY